MNIEARNTIEIDYPRCPDIVPEELVRLVEFQRAAEIIQIEFQSASQELENIQQVGLAAKDRQSLLGEFSLQGERQPLSLVDRAIQFKDSGLPDQWRITAVEMNAPRLLTAYTTDRVSYPDRGETTMSHFIYSGRDVPDTSPPGDLSNPDMSEPGGPNTGFRIILTDGQRVVSNYPRLVDGELVPAQLYIEGVSGTVPSVPGQANFANETESVSIGFVEEKPSGKQVRHEIIFDRGSDGAFVNLNVGTSALEEGWVLATAESRNIEEANKVTILANHPDLIGHLLMQTAA